MCRNYIYIKNSHNNVSTLFLNMRHMSEYRLKDRNQLPLGRGVFVAGNFFFFFILNCAELFDFQKYEYIELNKNNDSRVDSSILQILASFAFQI